MYLHTTLSFFRFTTRDVEYEAHVPVSGTVTEGCTHPGCGCAYTTVLDAVTAKSLWSAAEVHAAEEALGELWLAQREVSPLPYVLEAA